MDKSIASPELMRLSDSLFLLSGREYILNNDKSKDSITVSLFLVNKDGNINERNIIEEENRDKGYASLCVKDGIYYMSYYTGTHSKTIVKIIKFRVK